MGLLSRLEQRSGSPENPATSLSNPAAWLWDAFGATPNVSGVAINEKTALSVLAVFACVRIISEAVASLPLITYRRLTRGKERATDHAVYALLHDRPNPEMSAMTFRETLQAHVLTWGNAFAEIETNKAGTVIGLWPLLPDRTRARRVSGHRLYDTTLPDGTVATLSAERVFHMPGLSFDGLTGYSPIGLAKQSIGLTSAVEQFGAAFFGRGSTPSGILEHPAKLGAPALANLRESWGALQSGLSGAHRIAILEEGMQWKALGIPPNHAQFLETRKFQVLDIARLFRVPPHMLADLESGASYASVEQMGLDFVAYTLRPWLVRWEQTANYDLFGSRERNDTYVEHLVDGLLRGDIASRYAAYAVGRQWGWLSADDIREIENMNPLPDGQGSRYLVPLNMVAADIAGEVIPKKDTITGAGASASGTAPTAQRGGYLALFQDVGDRMVRRQVDQLRRAHRKQGEAGWTQAIEAVNGEHRDALAKALTPIFEALISFGPPETRALCAASRSLASELADVEIAATRAALDNAGYTGAEALLVEWESSQSAVFANRAADFLSDLVRSPMQMAS